MKKTFNKYLSLIFVLLLSTFAKIHASEAVANSINTLTTHHCSVSLNYTKKSSGATFVPHHKSTDDRRNVEIIESNKVEDEEASTKKQYYKDYLETAFINALLFEQSSKLLQKNIYRPQNVIHESSLRLHVQFQVFII
ncbi:hypothetical protein KO504_02070 [Winogradskyella psychrotolerans]|uniref:hypothetical protein n=1 Tax=Winogradskyella psychrotolerans TaxID=1344585 RepID=UPI001C07B8BA|nr:hypothetical protein [Winogradskyella psychrotolerans]MBU2920118.1 hypothetical protein [Winogradskyella psychrotolerans]|eukprot:TRINITY_DN14780_c0_g1_i1.p1 TRINITY_DN14780_c0_g1~~TRINITY_DN14780_c0_g1_i1.p1  ORF type:complete len:138 (-),score=11.89 TRINITY_DN14780_c0_g1_i1:200-613(-)